MALRKLVTFDDVEGFPTSVVPGGDQYDANTHRISNVVDPTLAQDAATKNYVDMFVQGIAWKQPVRAATTAALAANTYNNGASGVGATLTANANGTIAAQDGVTLVNGDRLLVKNEAAPENNGLYLVTDVGSGGTPYVLTRVVDADTSTDLLQAAVFAEEGTVNGDTAWVGTADSPIVVGTTALPFIKFSSVAAAYTFDQGLLLTGASVTVELDTAAGAQTAGAGGGSSGLEFDVNTAAGKLRAAVHATGGLDRSATGLEIRLDPHANTAGNNPSDATSAAGLLNLRSPKVDDNYLINSAVAVADAVNWSTTNDRIEKSDAAVDAKSRVIGVARTAGTTGGTDTVEVVSHGIATGVLTAATVNTPYFLQAGGGIGTTLPGSGNRTIQVGKAKNATDLWVQIIDFGKKA